jgi:hypothetical protein
MRLLVSDSQCSRLSGKWLRNESAQLSGTRSDRRRTVFPLDFIFLIPRPTLDPPTPSEPLGLKPTDGGLTHPRELYRRSAPSHTASLMIVYYCICT